MNSRCLWSMQILYRKIQVRPRFSEQVWESVLPHQPFWTYIMHPGVPWGCIHFLSCRISTQQRYEANEVTPDWAPEELPSFHGEFNTYTGETVRSTADGFARSLVPRAIVNVMLTEYKHWPPLGVGCLFFSYMLHESQPLEFVALNVCLENFFLFQLLRSLSTPTYNVIYSQSSCLIQRFAGRWVNGKTIT
jgi:hypothetical protein